MSDQLEIKGIDLAATLRDGGIRRADDGADEEWKREAEYQLDMQILKGGYFTANDVRNSIPPEYVTRDTRALGGIMRRAANAGSIRKVGITQARNASQHKGYVTLWEVVI